MEPKISIIMPAFNSESRISVAINSVLNQSFEDWELIIINDGSQDGTLEVIKKFQKSNTKIKIINRKYNKGIAFSRNQGIIEATGKYIAFLDSDDTWLENKLEKQLDCMENNGVEFSCTSYYVIDEDNKILTEVKKKQGFYYYQDLLKTNFIGCLTVMIKREIMVNNLMPEINHEDYATWLSILSKNIDLFFFDMPLSCYHKSSNSQSSNKIKALDWAKKIIYQQEGISFIKKRYFFLRYLFFTGIKYIKK